METINEYTPSVRNISAADLNPHQRADRPGEICVAHQGQSLMASFGNFEFPVHVGYDPTVWGNPCLVVTDGLKTCWIRLHGVPINPYDASSEVPVVDLGSRGLFVVTPNGKLPDLVEVAAGFDYGINVEHTYAALIQALKSLMLTKTNCREFDRQIDQVQLFIGQATKLMNEKSDDTGTLQPYIEELTRLAQFMQRRTLDQMIPNWRQNYPAARTAMVNVKAALEQFVQNVRSTSLM